MPTSTASTEPRASATEPTVAELRPGQPFRGSYACVRKDRMTARNGAPYLAVEMRDRTGTIKARAFRDADRLAAAFDAGDAIAVRGRSERFRGELVAELEEIRRVPAAEVDPARFLPSAYRSVSELEGFAEHLAREIADPALRAVVERVVFTEPLATEFRRAPCTRRGHHAYLGGLLEHSVAVATLALEVCQQHPRLDSDLLIAAALVHDAGKVREFSYGADFELTEEGRMLGHLAIGAEIVGAQARDLPPERRVALLHCVLAHHGPDGLPTRARGGGGAGGFGSPEALALARLNSLDASVKGALEGSGS